MNWLSSNIYAGLGIPSSFISEGIESIDFAKTLSMQNSRFIRDIIVEQSTISKGLSKVLQNIYKIEYKEDLEENEDTNKNSTLENYLSFDLNTLSVNFPSPLSLNMTNLSDQLSNLVNIIDPISETIIADENDLETAKILFKEKMFKKYLSTIEWADIKALKDELANDLLEQKRIKRKRDFNKSKFDQMNQPPGMDLNDMGSSNADPSTDTSSSDEPPTM